MSGFTEVHAHFLYGLDDGAQTREDMERMLDAACADGVKRLYATPHVTPGLSPIETELMARRLDEARRYCLEKGYPMKLFSGAEILYTPAIFRYAQEHELPTLGDSKCILLEFTPMISYAELKDAVAKLTRMNYSVMLAHVERYRCLYFGNAFLLKRKLRVAYQVNAGAVLRAGRTPRDWELKQWFRHGLIDCVSSDAHNCANRPFRMEAAYLRLLEWVDDEYAECLVGLRASRWTAQ